MAEKGMLIVVSAPSGTGKGAIIEKLLADDSNITHSVSATTRQPRKGEVDGVSYYFLKRPEFEDMIEKGALIEWDEYVGNYYGTPRKYIDERTAAGGDVILDITVAGAVNIKKECPEAVMIFVLPPSIDELERRIRERGTDSADAISNRLNKAYAEFKHVGKYEYVVVNDDLDSCVAEVKTIIASERMKYTRNPSIMDKLYKGDLK
jgi:guanylate kinase